MDSIHQMEQQQDGQDFAHETKESNSCTNYFKNLQSDFSRQTKIKYHDLSKYTSQSLSARRTFHISIKSNHPKVKALLLVFSMVKIPKMNLSFKFLVLFSCFTMVFCNKALNPLRKKEIITNNSKSDKFPVEFNTSVDFKYSQNRSNIYFSTTESGAKSTLKNLPKHFSLLLLSLVIALFILLINVRVFYLVTAGIKGKSRSVNIFLTHLSALAITFTLVCFFHALDKSNILSVQAPGLCELLSFLRIGLLSVYPLNAVAIIYVRVTSSTGTTAENVLPFRVICLIWLIALVGNFPSVFMVKYTKDPLTQLESCKTIPLFGRYELTILYEVFRFMIFHFLECAYMAFVMFQIRSKIKYLYILKPIPNPRMRRKVQRVRYLYLHSIIFILIWFPTGVVIAIYKVLSRTAQNLEYVNNFIPPLMILCTSLFILSPLTYLLLQEDVSGKSFCGLSLSPKTSIPVGENINESKNQDVNDIEVSQHGTRTVNEQQSKAKNKGKELHEATDMSRISTLGDGSNTADLQVNSTEANIPAVQPTSTNKSSVTCPLVESKDSICVATPVLQSFGKETTV